MEFIKVEQFLEQPAEVREVFIDWWNCEVFDLYAWFWDFPEHLNIESCVNKIQAHSINKGKVIKRGKATDDIIPLFTEEQLRKFIEDKLKIKVQFSIHFLTLDYIMLINDLDKVWIHTGTDDLLQAYWKVACMIAKGERK